MSGASKPLPPLKGAQAAASDPDAHVWLSASAGTGKTQVLAARVFRLLLRGVDPAAILCLTFTKAGAAEMAGRISDRLARWVRMPDTQLTADLVALGERGTPAERARARTLFAKVLDAPGGGLRIQTIHGFCQGLLAAFPVEAGLSPGFRPLEAREEAVLQREALAAMLADAEAEGRTRPVAVIGALSLRLGEGGAEGFLTACARALAGLEALPSGVQPWLRRTLDLPSGPIEEALAEGCDAIDMNAVHRIVAANRAWGTATGDKRAGAAERWLAAEPAARATSIRALLGSFLTQKGTPFRDKGLLAVDPELGELSQQLGEHCLDLLSLVDRAAYADLLADGLEVGRDYARAYAQAKRRAGAVDFDDLIRTAVRLFQQPGIGEWVRYKLDQTTAHVLIDEAQDTNAHQWAIVRALADEFFVGRGIHAPDTRTLFTVGDYKQAIFGFQGTDPLQFAAAEKFFARKAADALGDDDWASHDRGLPMHRLALVHSFRSTKPVLEFVDAAVAAIPDPGLGTFAPPEPHASEVAGPGTITLWPPVAAGGDADDEESWIDEPVRELAKTIARAVRGWLADPSHTKRDGSRLRPEDVMILVKRRGELASLLVARLYAEGVPVAGVDRLRLNTPLAVQDLLAAVRFALQPDDDLSLASLLVSPLMGWSQEALLAAAPRPDRVSLWRHLRDTQPADALAPLAALLGRADFATPYQLLEELLSGPLDGRRKLLERLGAEARDPIEELLNAALTFESTTTPSLQRFLDWFDRGEVEIVRDPSAPLDAVRVMTAHGAKGLQAPLVILADACVDPTQSPRSVVQWTHDPEQPPIPVFRPRKDERGEVLGAALDAVEKRELEEHWRLFYVAATRAEEQLVIAGSLGPRAKGVPPSASWYAVAAQAMGGLGVAEGPGERVFTGVEQTRPVPRRALATATVDEEVPIPAWARRPAPLEARPSRPLAPSSIGEDAVSDPPPTPAMRAAAERGRLIHALFERLPGVASEGRARAADRWLRDTGGVADAAVRDEIAGSVCRIIADPRFADLFGPESLAEAPITAVVEEGLVVSGTVDRLLVTAARVRVVDFKTSRRAPATLADVPSYHLRQMSAYAHALRVIFPGRLVEAGLLYTATPVLFELPDELLARHKPGFAQAEQS
ncbi:double-strand break repair helicase AddA [Sphingomonas sp.]|jgi:ATP-dependent helicase/nuclease subunit A|uniref:double-strand break repair helicase AddA n=1 Tax=Sphingomonas sp. TaxID=28214 RepID=UPI002D7FC9CC|nr:double-strand break repair helicase AddA [Sphingomonas sp.]HEU0044863.1 double-strand break repair helicase AddA [Sphingomonas sp.]